MNASPATTLAQDTDDASEFDRLPARAKLLDAIFTIGARHDKDCQMYDRAAYAYYGITAGSAGVDDAPLNDLRYKVIELCATIAEAALSRLPALEPFGIQLVDSGLIVELTGDELEAFLRPIFEDSGIGDRFVSAEPN